MFFLRIIRYDKLSKFNLIWLINFDKNNYYTLKTKEKCKKILLTFLLLLLTSGLVTDISRYGPYFIVSPPDVFPGKI